MSRINTNPTGYAGYQIPVSAFQDAAVRRNLFSTYEGPTQFAPFDFSNGLPGQAVGVISQLMPTLLSLGPRELTITQFNGNRNLFERLQAAEFAKESYKSRTFGFAQDSQNIAQTITGGMQLAMGRAATMQERAAHAEMGDNAARFLPMLQNFLGIDNVDRAMGSRGSATIFADQLHKAMYTSRDPVSGAAGYSGASAGAMANDLYEQLYGKNYDPQRVGGLRAGQMGQLARELQVRGLMGPAIGAMSLEEQRLRLPDKLDADQVKTIVQRQMAERRAKGETITDADLQTAESNLQDTFDRIKDPQANLTRDDIASMSGGEDILRSVDTTRYSKKLQQWAKSVRTVQDIFGDEGRPDAPMREIINALENLTQNSMGVLGPEKTADLLRRVQIVAKQTGLGIEGIQQINDVAASIGDKLDVDRAFSIKTAADSGRYISAVRDTGYFDKKGFGVGTAEELAQREAQLRTQAIASPMFNQVSAAMRMVDNGMIDVKKGSELEAYLEAVKKQRPTYDFEGKLQTVIKQNDQFARMLAEGGGVLREDALSILADTQGSLDAGQKYDVATTVRRAMSGDITRKVTGPALAARIRESLGARGVNKSLISAGLVADENGIKLLMDNIGRRVAKGYGALSSEEFNDEEKLDDRMGAITIDALKEELQLRNPNMSKEDISKVLEQTNPSLVDQKQISTIGQVALATLDKAARSMSAIGTRQKLYALTSDSIEQSDVERERGVRADMLRKESVEGLGVSDPVAKMVDAIKAAGPDADIMSIVKHTLGVENYAEALSQDPAGPVAKALSLIQEQNAMDMRDPDLIPKLETTAKILKGLTLGGKDAEEAIKVVRDIQTPEDSLREKIVNALRPISRGTQRRSVEQIKDETSVFNKFTAAQQYEPVGTEEYLAQEKRNQAILRGINEGGAAAFEARKLLAETDVPKEIQHEMLRIIGRAEQVAQNPFSEEERKKNQIAYNQLVATQRKFKPKSKELTEQEALNAAIYKGIQEGGAAAEIALAALPKMEANAVRKRAVEKILKDSLSLEPEPLTFEAKEASLKVLAEYEKTLPEYAVDSVDYAKQREHVEQLRRALEGDKEAAAKAIDAVEATRDKTTKARVDLIPTLQDTADDPTLAGRQQLATQAYVEQSEIRNERLERTSEQLKKLRENQRKKPDEITRTDRELVNTILNESVKLSKDLRGDEISMEQLGKGGVDKLLAIERNEAIIREQQKTEKARLGRDVDIHEIVYGGDGIRSDATAIAKNAFDRNVVLWQSVIDTRKLGALPGEGMLPENLVREKRTEAERAKNAAMLELGKGKTREEQAELAASSLVDLSPESAKAELTDSKIRKLMVDAVVRQDSSKNIFLAAEAHKTLVKMAVARGLYDDVSDPAKLSNGQRAEAVDRLDKAELSQAERADVAKLKDQAKFLRPVIEELAQPGKQHELILESLQGTRLQTNPPPPATPQKSDKIKLSGTVTIKSDGTADVDFDGVDAQQRIYAGSV